VRGTMTLIAPPKTRLIDPYSCAVSLLTMTFQGTELSVGTCFFWELGAKTYLITNWHNVSGINAQTGKHLSTHAGEPNEVQIDTYVGRDLNKRGTASIRLDDDSGPKWLEHPILGRSVDVVCLELPDDISANVFPINKLEQHKLMSRIADEVFILGYPLGIGVEKLPIWKRASIASEIDFDVDNEPKFLVDTASSSGMSGSPVIRRSTGGGQTEDGNFQMGISAMSRFIGIYSGRIAPKGNLEAQLGIVWKAVVIDQIINGSIKGDRSVPPKPRNGYIVSRLYRG
jgi:hypothetical protein